MDCSTQSTRISKESFAGRILISLVSSSAFEAILDFNIKMRLSSALEPLLKSSVRSLSNTASRLASSIAVKAKRKYDQDLGILLASFH